MDPVRDLDIINEELRLKDEEAFGKVYKELAAKYERGEKKLKLEYVSHTDEVALYDSTGRGCFGQKVISMHKFLYVQGCAKEMPPVQPCKVTCHAQPNQPISESSG